MKPPLLTVSDCFFWGGTHVLSVEPVADPASISGPQNYPSAQATVTVLEYSGFGCGRQYMKNKLALHYLDNFLQTSCASIYH